MFPDINRIRQWGDFRVSLREYGRLFQYWRVGPAVLACESPKLGGDGRV